MTSVHYLREFISERLTAAASEIFEVFEKTIVQYEEEIDRQHRLLLNISLKPEIKLHTAELLQKHVHQKIKDVRAEQQVCSQGRSFSLDQEEPEPPQIKEEQEEPEAPQIKEEQEELCSVQEPEQLVLKEEADTFMVPLTDEESDQSEAEPNGDQLRLQPGTQGPDFGSTSKTKLMGKKSCPKIPSSKTGEDLSPLSESESDTEVGKVSVKCGVCEKVFKNKYYLKMHHRIHTGAKPYVCKECGKRFNDASTLKYHTRTHTGEKPFSCETCGKSFRCSYSVLVHMRTHTGEKPYPCDTCGKRFTNLSAFKWHTAIHTGEKRYSCKICGKSFTQNGNLTAHMGTHTGEKRHFCKICGKSFSRSSNLLVHMRNHTGEKPYPCNTCGERFKYAAMLKKHLKTHEGAESSPCQTCGRGPAGRDGSAVQHEGDLCPPETSAGKTVCVGEAEENESDVVQ
ncbi:zinc finger and SCAN domain-containing protein 2-like [Kryptolebias marmoratus]|uniref:zinc finger and SCAN domain-containing protein 2-like n=1 Tax=Kryptolebias marmoratus TaxID=37003 RepID=UPI0007F8D750|nr:zinc finger and SCAN domain-containing protein 2-like [Kryptolebias marmoratus]